MKHAWPARKTLLRAASAALVLALVGWMGWKVRTANFATVMPGRVYRSGQMRAPALARVVHARRIKTVLNLRGPNPDEAWYRAERAATLAQGATQIDVAMSSCEWMSRAQLQALIRVLDTCDYPILIHCHRGAERTGLVSSFIELLRPGVSLRQARAQFSIRYLFLPVGDGALLPGHLDQYQAWLEGQGAEHSPALFRKWANGAFQPGKPSREFWPYDPHPLVVVTRPEPAALRPQAAQTGQTWR